MMISTRQGGPVSLVLAAVLAASAAAPSTAFAEDVRFALVIGHNDSDDPDLTPLRYADDDAARYHELFSHLSRRAELLTTFDDETRTLIGPTVLGRVPTRAAVEAALDRLHAEMVDAASAGDRPILYVVYSGHGNYDAEGRGYIHLADGRFTTRDLFHRVISPNRAHPVVLIIDAGNAALLVNARGAGERRSSRPSTLRLDDYPSVGLILASSKVGETHEWGRYLAGVFSHEVRSGLLGAADLDDDARVTFAELASFIAAANARVTNPNVRVTPYIRPPLTAPQLPLVDLRAMPARVRVDASAVAGKAHVVDDDLVRYADFHSRAGAAAGSAGFWLALTRPSAFTVVVGETEYLIPAGATGQLNLVDLPIRPRSVVSARGAGSAYFQRTLFHEPYDRGFADRYLTTEYLDGLRLEHVVARPWYENDAAWGFVGGGLAAAAVGAGLHVHALNLEERGRGAPFASDRPAINDDIETFQTSASVLYGVGGAAIIAGISLFVFDRPTRVETYDPPLSVEMTGTGVRLKTDW